MRRISLPMLMLLPLVACGGGKTLLRFHPRTGTYRYTMQQTMSMSLSGGGAGGPAIPAGEASLGAM